MSMFVRLVVLLRAAVGEHKVSPPSKVTQRLFQLLSWSSKERSIDMLGIRLGLGQEWFHPNQDASSGDVDGLDCRRVCSWVLRLCLARVSPKAGHLGRD